MSGLSMFGVFVCASGYLFGAIFFGEVFLVKEGRIFLKGLSRERGGFFSEGSFS